MTGCSITVHPHGHGQTYEDLWRDALRCAGFLRPQAGPSPYPVSVFQPFAIITAVDHMDLARGVAVRLGAMTGGRHPHHDERVRSLCNVADLLGMCGPPTELPKGTWN